MKDRRVGRDSLSENSDDSGAGDMAVSQQLVLRQQHSAGAKCEVLHLLQSSLGVAPLEWALFTEGGGCSGDDESSEKDVDEGLDRRAALC